MLGEPWQMTMAERFTNHAEANGRLAYGYLRPWQFPV
jgi:hypothetical protein